MKSAKEQLVENKILQRVQKYPLCGPLLQFLFNDIELHEMQDYSNVVSIKRLGFNDHGPVHMRQVTSNAIKLLELLHGAGVKTSLETEETGTFEDSLCAVVLAAMTHDLGMMIGRQDHEDLSLAFALKVIERALLHMFKDDIKKRVILRAVAAEAIVGHMAHRTVHSLEAGIILLADGCDMTKGRARIPLSMLTAPRAGDIHIYSANAITRVAIRHGENKPVRIDVEMSSEVGFFQIEEVLLPKVNSSPAKQHIEIYAGVTGQEAKRYL